MNTNMFLANFLIATIIFSVQEKMMFGGESKNNIMKNGFVIIPILEKDVFGEKMTEIAETQKMQQQFFSEFQLKQSVNELDKWVSSIENLRNLHLELVSYFSDTKNSKLLIDVRQPVASSWLSFYKSMADVVDENFDFNNMPFSNIAPNGGPYPAGIAPENIQEPEIRKDYEERLAKNAKYALEYRLQRKLKKITSLSSVEINAFIIKSYHQAPRADIELVQLLEQYKYPEEENVKVFKSLDIPYKGFREWKTNDGLFTLVAKVVSANKKEVVLEKSDGKQITIELSALRQADQDYVKERLATPKP